jgi:hypothetical protein
MARAAVIAAWTTAGRRQRGADRRAQEQAGEHTREDLSNGEFHASSTLLPAQTSARAHTANSTDERHEYYACQFTKSTRNCR